MSELGAAAETYLRLKVAFGGATSSYVAKVRARAAKRRGQESRDELPEGIYRDPVPADALLAAVFAGQEWRRPIARARVIESWPELVGEMTASHATPLHVDHGVLIVQCDSTAWATQLRRIRPTLLKQIVDREPEAGIDELRFLNPGAPSWKHGPRSVPGRGPRDTYG